MDVDDTPAKTGSKSTDEGGEEDYSEVMNDPEFLQVIIHLSLYVTYLLKTIVAPIIDNLDRNKVSIISECS